MLGQQYLEAELLSELGDVGAGSKGGGHCLGLSLWAKVGIHSDFHAEFW